MQILKFIHRECVVSVVDKRERGLKRKIAKACTLYTFLGRQSEGGQGSNTFFFAFLDKCCQYHSQPSPTHHLLFSKQISNMICGIVFHKKFLGKTNKILMIRLKGNPETETNPK